MAGVFFSGGLNGNFFSSGSHFNLFAPVSHSNGFGQGSHSNLFARVLSSGLFINVASAREYPDLFPTPKGRAMGGALTAICDDYNSLYYNPAGLAYIDESSVRAPELMQTYVSPGALDFYHKIKGFKAGSSTAEIASSLKKFDGEGLGLGLDLLGFGWYHKRIGIAVNLFSFNGSFRIRVPSVLFAKVHTRITEDSAVSLGYGHPFLDNHLRVGFTARPFMLRGGVDRDFVGSEIQGIKFDKIIGFGWGSDFDLGIQGNLDPIPVGAITIKPMAGVVLQNALGTNFNKKVTEKITEDPPPLDRRINAGVGASIGNLGAFVPTLTVEERDLLVKTDSPLEHLSAAAEFAFQPRRWYKAFLRGHFAKGNVGGGIGGKLWATELEVGSYAVNLGSGPGIGRDRRTYISLATEW